MAAEIVHHGRSGKNTESESVGTCTTRRKIKVRFSLTMLSEDLETEELQKLPNPEELEDIDDLEDDCFTDDTPLLVALGSMSISLGDETDSSDFCSSDHQLNEIMVTPEQVDFACSTCQFGKVTMAETIFLKPIQQTKYIATSFSNQISLVDRMIAKITIFHIRVTCENEPRGKPVVLNFTNTENFICCTEQGKENILKSVKYDKQLLLNCADDPIKPSLIFYMTESSSEFKFESALHKGWFIYTVDGQVLKMKSGEVTASNCFNKIRSTSTEIIRY